MWNMGELQCEAKMVNRELLKAQGKVPPMGKGVRKTTFLQGDVL